MAIKLSCPNPTCRKGLTARDEMAGRKVKCPACGGTIDIPAGNAGNGGLDQLEEVQASAPRRRPAPPPEDDYDDYDRPARRAPAGGGLFASKGLSGAGTIFLFAGVGMLLVLAVSVFFPWRSVNLGGMKLGGDFNALAQAQFPEMPDIGKMPKMPKMDFGGGLGGMPGAPSLTGNGIQTLGGKMTLIAAIGGIAFVLVALFALNQLVLKISLWTAFGLSIVGMLFGLLAALLKTTTLGITEGGAWGAWVAMITGLVAAVMFILAVLGMRSVGGAPRRRPAPPADDY